MQQRGDPWVPFRIWVAFSIGLYALRATFVITWPGAIPGWVLLALVAVALFLAAKALLWPGRITPWREGEPGLWSEISEDWRHWWRRRGG